VRSLSDSFLAGSDQYGSPVTENHVLLNRAGWDADADNWVEPGHKAWSSDEITWGAWSVPESDLHVLPDVDALDVVELGCGTPTGRRGSPGAGLGR
jgi:hypothetical protein